MKPSILVAALLLLVSFIAPASAGLGALSSPQRARCENQASAKIAMWHWFARRDFVERCVAGNSGKSRKRISSR